jgi:hypothetical protein
LKGLWVAAGALAWCGSLGAQTQADCGASGYRVIASRWDAVLGKSWEVRQDCAHPEWPAHLVAVAAPFPFPIDGAAQSVVTPAAAVVRPPLIHAGDFVKLWEQNAMVRIEMHGVAEQSARAGERVVVRITRETDDAGLTLDRIGGVVRGVGDVEMER